MGEELHAAAVGVARQLRARFIAAPDGLAPPALTSITIENASMPLPLYLLRGPIAMMRGLMGLE